MSVNRIDDDDVIFNFHRDFIQNSEKDQNVVFATVFHIIFVCISRISAKINCNLLG